MIILNPFHTFSQIKGREMSLSTIITGSVFAVASTAYFALRMGYFGYNIIKINKDDDYETISRGPFGDTAYWNPGDVHVRVYHFSLKPIRFEYTNEYTGMTPSKN